MLDIIQPEVRTSVFLFIATILALLLIRPSLLFAPSGDLLQFGWGEEGQSLLAAPILTMMLPVLFYLWARVYKITLF